jgi:hypothetical protein
VDIKRTGELAVGPARSEPRELPRDAHERETSPGVIVEIGRPPDLPGTYNARGLVEGSSAAKVATSPNPTAAPEAARAERAPPPMIPSGPPEAMRVPGNAQVQTLANASPQVAAALRPTVPLVAPHLHPPALALTAGIQPLAPTALKQTEKSSAAAEQEDEMDPLHEEKERPVPASGRRGR